MGLEPSHPHKPKTNCLMEQDIRKFAASADSIGSDFPRLVRGRCESSGREPAVEMHWRDSLTDEKCHSEGFELTRPTEIVGLWAIGII